MGKISIHGSMLSWLYDVLLALVKGSIASGVSSALSSALKSFVNDDLAHILSSLQLKIPIHLDPPYDIALLDSTFTSILTNASHVTFDVKAEVESRNASDPSFPGVPAQLPDVPPVAFETYMISVSIKQMVFNSALWVFWQKGLLTDSISEADVPASLPIQLVRSDGTCGDRNRSKE